jgi:hypothetical protein
MKHIVYLREAVTDRVKAHRIRQFSRCVIDTKRGGRLVSTHGPGHEPSKRLVLAALAREQRIAEEHRRMSGQTIAMSCALLSISEAVHQMHAEGLIGAAVAPRILGEATQILNDAKAKGYP